MNTIKALPAVLLTVLILSACTEKQQNVLLNDGHIFTNEFKPVFHWNLNENENLIYTVQISTSETFEQTIAEESIENSDSLQLKSPLNQDTVYYIRLGSKQNESDTIRNWSEPISFKIRTRPPKQFDDTTILTAGNPQTINIKNYENTQRIFVEINENKSFSDVIYHTSVDTRQMEGNALPLEDLNIQGEYYIRFQASYAGYQNTTEWSYPYKINIEPNPFAESAETETAPAVQGDGILAYIREQSAKEDGQFLSEHYPDNWTCFFQGDDGTTYSSEIRYSEYHEANQLHIFTEHRFQGYLNEVMSTRLPSDWNDVHKILKSQKAPGEKDVFVTLLEMDRSWRDSLLAIRQNGSNRWIRIETKMITKAANDFTGGLTRFYPDGIKIRDFKVIDEKTLLLCGNYTDDHGDGYIGWVGLFDIDTKEFVSYYEADSGLETSFESLVETENGTGILALYGTSFFPSSEGSLHLKLHTLSIENGQTGIETLWESELFQSPHYNWPHNEYFHIELSNVLLIQNTLYTTLNTEPGVLQIFNVGDENRETLELVKTGADIDYYFTINRLIPAAQAGELPIMITGSLISPDGFGDDTDEKPLIIQYNGDLPNDNMDLNREDLTGTWTDFRAKEFFIADTEGNCISGRLNGSWYGTAEYQLAPESDNTFQHQSETFYPGGGGPEWEFLYVSPSTLIVKEIAGKGFVSVYCFSKVEETPEIIWK